MEPPRKPASIMALLACLSVVSFLAMLKGMQSGNPNIIVLISLIAAVYFFVYLIFEK